MPFVASQPSPETPRNAYDLIKYELAYWLSHEMEDKGRMPTDQEMQYEACRIVFGSEVSSSRGISSAPSWLRDLIMADEQITMGARLSPIRGPAENRMSVLRINGKDNIFEDDPFELELREYVKARQMLGLTAMDGELQVEACRIIGRMEEMSNKPFEMVANWLIRLIYASTSWLASFRRRCSLPRSEDIADGSLRSKDVNKIDSTVHNYSRLESELADFVKTQRSMGIVPTDSDIQRQARIIIYEYDDDWNQTAADNPQWLAAFKQRHCVESPASSSLDLLTTQPLTIESAGSGKSKAVTRPMSAASQSRGVSQAWNQMQTNLVKTGPFFLNDANCYRRLARELHRWVASTMSPNNPNRHVPSDDELQHQARWILYDE